MNTVKLIKLTKNELILKLLVIERDGITRSMMDSRCLNPQTMRKDRDSLSKEIVILRKKIKK